MLQVGVNPIYVALVAAASLGFVTTGLIVWQQRPSGVIGPLLWLVGVTWLIPQWRYGADSLTWTLGTWVLPTLHQAVLVHLVFAYPTGVIRSQGERWVVAASYLAATVGALAVAAFARDPGAAGFPGFPRNIVLVDPDVDVWRALVATKTTVELVLAVLILVMVARRWRRSSGLARRRLGPFLLGGGIAALSFSAGYTAVGIRSPFLSGFAFDMLVIRWPIAVLYLVVPIALGWGVLRERLDRSGLADLVMTADDHGRGLDALQAALARALRDPSLELLVVNSADETFLRPDGSRASLPDGSHRRIATLVERKGRPLGAVVHDRALLDDRVLLDAVIASARLALDNHRLLEELTVQLEEVRASRSRIVEATDAERRRIERNLHDGAQQQLVSLALLLSLAADGAANDDHPALPGQLDAARTLVLDTLEDVRRLAHGIHPAVLAEEGLSSAIEALARSSSLHVDVVGSVDGRLGEAVEAAAYYFVAEALTNIAKYAGTAKACVRVEHSERRIEIEVSDDGVGGASLAGGSGLQGLSDRITALGGSFEVRSTPGAGTRLQATLPCK
jgi:signal transduction histidine kinase